jgi:hypothetical protein
MSGPARVRLQFEMSGPDGRQSGPLTVDVPVQPGVTRVEGVKVNDATTATWTFDRPVTCSGGAEQRMQIGGHVPIATFNSGEPPTRFVTAIYSNPPGIHAGDAWLLSAPLTHLRAEFPIVLPESGVTT